MEFRALIRLASAIVLLLCSRTCCSQAFESCKLGECVDALTCQFLRSAFILNGRSPEVIDTIKQHRCGDMESRSVCCTDLEAHLVGNDILASGDPDANSTSVLGQLLQTPCGMSSGSDRILNGVQALLFEFPWMALLEFEHNSTEERKFLCAGSLINERYVLTAAHCFTTPDAELVNVRLGEYDTSSELDCDRLLNDVCAPPVANHEVEDVVIHKEFKTSSVFNDIALIRLKEQAVYGDRILPICLPILKELRRVIEFAEVAGWGLTASGNTSDILQKATVPVLSNDFCAKRFPRSFSSGQICAGGVKGRDTCRGDSGGPLFTRGGRHFLQFVQYGILSGGGAVCGGNNTVPSIYTNVGEYMPWIINNMKP